MADKEKVEFWAVVELFGHQQIAGHLSEAEIGGCSFVRVDVPEIGERPAFTKYYGNGAIYSMTPTSEAIARAAAERIAQMNGSPLSVYVPELEAAHQVIRQAEQLREQQRALPAGGRDPELGRYQSNVGLEDDDGWQDDDEWDDRR